MYSSYIEEIEQLYNTDYKKIRNGTKLYGHLFDDRWQTHIYKPLSLDDIKILEEEYGELPNTYKELLQTMNGCYLFDLIQIAGKREISKGMSREEQIRQPSSLRDIKPYLGKKKLAEGLLVFASSMVSDSFFAFNKDENVLQIGYKKLDIIKVYESLHELLKEIMLEGAEMVKNGEYIDFY